MKLYTLAIIILLVGCSQSTANDPINVNYKSGTQGLDIQLVPNHPPSRLFESSTFTIAAQINNNGAYDTAGEIALIGLDQKYTPLRQQLFEIPPLQGRSESNSLGDFYIQEFPGDQLSIPAGAKEYRAKYLLVATYEYLTILNANVCVNPALLDIERQQSSCTMQPKQGFSGQGAPVAFTSVEEVVTPMGDGIRIEFTLTIENRGNGEVYSSILIDDVRLGTKPLTCNRRELSLDDLKQRRNTVVCSRTEPREAAYTSTLSATAQYTYKTTKPGEFVVQRIR